MPRYAVICASALLGVFQMGTWTKGKCDDALPPGARLRLGTTAMRHQATTGNEGVSALAFSPDGKILAAAGCEDGRISLWDVLTGRMIRVLTQKSYRIQSLAFSSDGKYLAVGDDDAAIHLWDYKTGKLLRKLTGDWGIHALAFSPDSTFLAAANFSNTVCLFDPASGKRLREWQGEKGKSVFDLGECFSALAFSPDGKMLAAGSGRETLREVNPAELARIKEQFWKEHVDSGINKELLKAIHDRIGQNPNLGDGKSYVPELWERIWVWEVATGKELHKLDARSEMTPSSQGATSGVSGLGFINGSKQLVSCSWRGNLLAWDLSRGKPLDQPKLIQKMPAFTRLAISPDQQKVALTGTGITLLDTTTFKPVRNVKQPFGHRLTYVSAFSPDALVLATAQHSGSIYLWDVNTGKDMSPGSRHYHWVDAVAFTADGKRVVTLSGDDALLWDKTGKEVGRLQGLPRADKFSLSPDGRRIAVTGLVPAKKSFFEASVWDWDEGKPLWKRRGVTAVAFLNKDRVALGLEDGAVEIADSSTGKAVRKLPGSKLPVKALAASPDGAMLVAHAGEGMLQVWHLSKDMFEKIAVPKVEPYAGTRAPYDLVFSPDGKKLAWYTEDGTTIVFDAATWRETLRFQPKQLAGRYIRTYTVAFTTEGRVLAAGTAPLTPDRDDGPDPRDYTAWVWDPTTGKELWTSPANEQPIASIAISPDGRTLVTGSWDTTALVWDLTKPAR